MDDYDTIENNKFDEHMALVKRKFTSEQITKYEGYIAEIFTALGMDLNTPSTFETPRRYIQALIDATEGYEGDPKVMKAFPTECTGGEDCDSRQVIEGPIQFFALCEHHAFPFYGHAYVGYIADNEIIGISKLTRIVRIFAKRFAVQERIGTQIADTLFTMMKPHGVAVFLDAHHLCVEMRGVRESSPITRTTFWRGRYCEDGELRSEFLRITGMGR